MKTMAVLGIPSIDSGLARVPYLVVTVSPHEQHVGYKSWKVPRLGRATNWLQWNDGDVRLRISFPNQHGTRLTWKLFARFDAPPPSGLWDRPERYERAKAQWMPAGSDVWGCSYESLTANAGRLSDAGRALVSDLELSCQYALGRYGT